MTAAGRVVVVPPAEGFEFSIGKDRILRKDGPSGPEPGFAVVEYIGAPQIPGPPLHVHRSFEEAWFILEGEVEFRSSGTTTRATRGAYLFVPRGVPHTFRVLGTEPARWIGIFSPGRYVSLLEELGKILPAHGPPDMTDVKRLFSRYETDLVEE